MWKFIKEFPYKKIYAAFPIYGLDRPVLLSLFLGAKYILFQKTKFFKTIFLRKTKYKILENQTQVQKFLTTLLSGITKEKLIDYPIKYNPPQISNETFNKLKNEEYIVLIPTASRDSKKIPEETLFLLLEKLKEYKVVLLGRDNNLEDLTKKIEEKNYSNIINLFNKTSLVESANILKYAKATISTDTGLMHLSYAQNTPTVGIFYEKETKTYIPDEKMYNVKIITQNQTSENIYGKLTELIK